MAAATMANNAIALVFTVLFARLLGAEDYGSLAALVSTFVILIASPAPPCRSPWRARSPRAGSDRGRGWRPRSRSGAGDCCWSGAAVTAAAVLLREPIADLISVPEEWAAAATAPTGVLWLLLSVERGALQGVHAYKPVGWSIVLEAFGRLVFGAGARGGRDGRDRRVPGHAAVAAGDRARAVVDRRGSASGARAWARARGGCGTWSAAPGPR